MGSVQEFRTSRRGLRRLGCDSFGTEGSRAMTAFARTDHSIFGKWWWTVDRWTLAVLAVLMGLGIVLVQAASPAVAERIGLDNFHFVQRHILTLIPTCLLMIGVSLMSPRGVRRTAVVALSISPIRLALTWVFGCR